ncbi:hypothetical protein JTE90_012612, partial [Oedothorax gibbosus]
NGKAAGEEEQELAADMAAQFLSENLDERIFGSPKEGSGMWASVIRILIRLKENYFQSSSCTE